MIGAYHTGYTAGSYAAYNHPRLLLEERRRKGKEEYERRKRAGIAHREPEDEFVRGFVDGYQMPSQHKDGLILYLAAAP